MHRIVRIAIVMVAVLGAACSAPAPTAAPTTAAPASPGSATAVPARSGTIRFSSNGEVDVLDVPRLLAVDSLKAQGYTVEQTVFASSDQIAVALDRGDIEFGSADSSTTWAAIGKGADIATVVGRAFTTFDLITRQELKSCSDLNGRPLALNSTTSVGYAMVQKYFKEKCPGVTPQLLVVNSSSSRAAAMQKGEVDGAWIELAAWLRFNKQAPGKFRPLVEFAHEFPQVQYTSFSVRRAWAKENPVMVQDYIRALLTAQRTIIADPGVLRDAIVKYVGVDSAAAQEAADAYLALGAWDANGGLTADGVQYTIDFLTSAKALPAGLKADQVADLSYLNAVLDEIGRK